MADDHVTIIGGGLAGLAAAVALAQQGMDVELYEARSRLGGRASSFQDPVSGEWIDFCQHVGMGCCTNLLDFCRRAGVADAFRRDRVLHFLSSDGRRHDVQATRMVPAPFHLLPSLAKLSYLSWSDKWGIGVAIWRLMRTGPGEWPSKENMQTWLIRQRQSPAAIERFWQVVLVSALGETLDRVSIAASRQVLIDGFLAARGAYELLVPRSSLRELFDQRLQVSLQELGVRLHLDTPVRRLTGDETRVTSQEMAGGTQVAPSRVVLAVPWQAAGRLLDDRLLARLPGVRRAEQFDAAPITGVHLRLDRKIVDVPHAVLVGRLSQWLFCRSELDRGEQEPSGSGGHYYQVVISASRSTKGQDRQEILHRVLDDLAAVFPAARGARLLHGQVVTERAAVFSPLPEIADQRPAAETPLENFALAGDWTDTRWPATMEGAVRSGYRAAEVILARRGKQIQLVRPDLPRGRLARWLIR